MVSLGRSNKRKDLPPQSPADDADLAAKSPKVTGTGRPKRSTQGQGGAAVQLQKVAEKIASVPPAKRMATNIPEPIGENPMAPQLARPKPRPLAKAPAHPLNASRPPVPSQLTQGLLPATGVPVGYPRHADAMAGSIYGFRPATPLAAPTPNPIFQREPPIDPALYAMDAQLQRHGTLDDRRHNLPPPYYRPGYGPALGFGSAPENAGAGGAWASGGGQLLDPEEDIGNEASGEEEPGDEDADEADDADEGPGAGSNHALGGELGGFSQDPRALEIDEQSPDEDERQALQLLHQPAPAVAQGQAPQLLQRQAAAAAQGQALQLLQQPPAAVAQGGCDVLAEFRHHNRAVRPPKQSRLNASQLPAAEASDSHEVDPSADSDVETNTPLGLQLAGKPLRSFRPIVKPSHMRFYNDKPGWLTTLDTAKNKFRLYICTTNPFPTIEHNSPAAVACITEAMSDFRKSDANATFQLDDAIYNQFRREMIKLLFNDGAAYRGRLKEKAANAVDHYYAPDLRPNLECGYGQAEYQSVVAGNVKELVGKRFLLGDRDEQGRATNYGHHALKSLCQDFYYSRARDALAKLYPDVFETLPIPCLVLAATAIANALDEYRDGSFVPTQFKGSAYIATYKKIEVGTQEVLKDAYHGPKLRRMLQGWANEARLLAGAITAVPSLADYNVVLD